MAGAAFHAELRAGLDDAPYGLDSDPYDPIAALREMWHDVHKLGRFKQQWLLVLQGKVNNSTLEHKELSVKDIRDFVYHCSWNQGIQNQNLERGFSTVVHLCSIYGYRDACM